MRKCVVTFAFLFVRLISSGQNDTLVLNGEYVGRNLYIESPGACVSNVLVNRSVYPITDYGNAFEIDLSLYKFHLGDSVCIEIIHTKGCAVKLFKGELINPVPTVEYLNISIDSTGLLKWKTKNEIGKFIFIVEQYRWEKWVKVGEVEGIGGYQEHEYSFQTFPTSGENKFRVKQYVAGKPPRNSDPAIYKSTVPPVKIKSLRIQTEIEFSSETAYELYDHYGNIITKGFGKTVDCTKLHQGHYYIHYDSMKAELDKI